MKSGMLSLNLKDVGKGLIMAILGAIAAFVQTSIAEGSLHFDWQAMGKIAILSAAAYLTKNIFTNNKDQLLTKDVPMP